MRVLYLLFSESMVYSHDERGLFDFKNLSRQINFGRVENLKNRAFIYFLNDLHSRCVVFSFPLDFHFHGIKRIDFDLVIAQMDPDPVITLSARLDVFKLLFQGSQDLVKMIPVNSAKITNSS